MERKIGKYEVVERMGRGGMAEVYRAYHATLDRYVAIKVLHTFLADAPEFRTRFEGEARHIARLKHPHIVQVYDFDFDDVTNSYYMVMELIDGPTLKDRIYDTIESGALFSLDDALRIATEAADALAYAHGEGMIHRDVKPANLMLDRGTRLVLTDFGIAKLMTNPTLTATGGMVGTPAYMSPEQGMGDLGDERSDLYALGVIMYEMLAGEVPYVAETPLALILKHVNDPVPSVLRVRSDLPRAIDQIIQKLMAKEPAKRYQKAEALISDLEKVQKRLKNPPISRPDPTKTTPVTPLPRKEGPMTEIGTSLDTPPASNVNVFLSRTREATLPKRPELRSPVPTETPVEVSEPEKTPFVFYLLVFLIFGVIIIGGYVVGVQNGLFPSLALFATDLPTSVFTVETPNATETMQAVGTATQQVIVQSTSSVETAQAQVNAGLTLTAESWTATPTVDNVATEQAGQTATQNALIQSTMAIQTAQAQFNLDLTATATANVMTLTPSATPNLTQTLSFEQTATTSACLFDYAIIEHSPLDGQSGGFFRVNEDYTRKITLLNIGTCAWPPNTFLAFIEGEDFEAGPRIFIRTEIEPAEEITLTFEGKLPATGSIRPIAGTWQLRTPGQVNIGEPFIISVMVFDPGSN